MSIDDENNQKNLAQKLLAIRVSSKLIKIFFVAISLFFCLLLILPSFLDNSALEFEIEQKISHNYGANFTINGGVKISFLPLPSIIAKDVLLQSYKANDFNNANVKNSQQEIVPSATKFEKTYNFYAESAQITLPFFEFITGFAVKKIIFNGALLESIYSQNAANLSESEFVKIRDKIANRPAKTISKESLKIFSLTKFDRTSIEKNFPQIIFKDSAMVFYDELSNKKRFADINFKADFNDKKISASGGFSSANIVSNFKLLARFNSAVDKTNSFLEISSPALQLKISGNFLTENHGIFASDFSGKLEAQISDLKNFYASYIDGGGLVSQKLNPGNGSIKISANLNKKAQAAFIEDLSINSSLFSGKGEVDFDFVGDFPLIDIDLNLENFDLDAIWSKDAVAVSQGRKNLPSQLDESSNQNRAILLSEGGGNQSINFETAKQIKNFELDAEIKIKSAKYFGGEIRNINLYSTVSKSGQIMIYPLIFEVPGEGIFRVNGILDNDSISPKFVGKIDAKGKALKEIVKWLKIESQNLKSESLRDYQIYSDILILPNSTSLSNFYLNLNVGQTELLGEVKFFTNEKTPNVSSRFQVSHFNIDDYFLTSAKNAYLSPGSLLHKVLWLNDITSSAQLSLNFDKLIYKGEQFNDQSVKLKFGRGYFEVSDLNMKSAENDFKANLNIDISGNVQKFNLQLSANDFHYHSSNSTSLVDGNGQIKSDKEKTQIPRNFLDQFFALPSLQGFEGEIAMNFVNLSLDDFAMSNVLFSGKLHDGNVVNSNFSCEVYGGEISYAGVVGIKNNKILSGNFSLKNISLKPFLSDLLNVDQISGIANISANIAASSDKKENFTKTLDSEIKFSANQPIVRGYGLNDLVRKMFNAPIYKNELSEPEKILFNSQAQTIFKQASGEIKINGGSDGKARINASAPALNAILSGKINAAENSADLLFNVVFLTGDSGKQIPLNIATNIRGKFSSLSQSTNLDQARQYLGLKKLNTAVVPQDSKDNSASKSATNDSSKDIEKTQILPDQNITLP